WEPVSIIEFIEQQPLERRPAYDRVATLRIKLALEAGRASREPTQTPVPDVTRARHATDRRRIQKTIALNVLGSGDRAVEQTAQVCSVHLTVAVHYRDQLSIRFKSVPVAGLGRSTDSKVSAVSERHKPGVSKLRKPARGVVAASVVNRHDQVDNGSSDDTARRLSEFRDPRL